MRHDGPEEQEHEKKWNKMSGRIIQVIMYFTEEPISRQSPELFLLLLLHSLARPFSPLLFLLGETKTMQWTLHNKLLLLLLNIVALGRSILSKDKDCSGNKGATQSLQTTGGEEEDLGAGGEEKAINSPSERFNVCTLSSSPSLPIAAPATPSLLLSCPDSFYVCCCPAALCEVKSVKLKQMGTVTIRLSSCRSIYSLELLFLLSSGLCWAFAKREMVWPEMRCDTERERDEILGFKLNSNR